MTRARGMMRQEARVVPGRDEVLVQIVDRALADATERARRADGSSWLACRPGCTPCCHGVFRISALDARRLVDGLEAMREREPERAAALVARADRLVNTLGTEFPGDVLTGALWDEDERWEAFADLPETDAACPVLDPETGRCELYASRPMTCRVFGPPVENEFGLGVCELCYVGASEEEMLAGRMEVGWVEAEMEAEAEAPGAETAVAWAVGAGNVQRSREGSVEGWGTLSEDLPEG